MRTSKALWNLKFTRPTGRVYILEVFYLSEGLAFNDFVKTHYSNFSIVYFSFHGFLKVKIEQRQTRENVWDIFV